MKKMKIFILSLLVVIFLVLLGIVNFIYYRENKIREPILKVLKTEATISFIAESIRKVALHGIKHPVSMEYIAKWISENEHDDLVKLTKEKNSVLDAWEKPIIINYKAPTTYQFISYGPNRQDDAGAGDDIVKVFDLSGDEIKEVK